MSERRYTYIWRSPRSRILRRPLYRGRSCHVVTWNAGKPGDALVEFDDGRQLVTSTGALRRTT